MWLSGLWTWQKYIRQKQTPDGHSITSKLPAFLTQINADDYEQRIFLFAPHNIPLRRGWTALAVRGRNKELKLLLELKSNFLNHFFFSWLKPTEIYKSQFPPDKSKYNCIIGICKFIILTFAVFKLINCDYFIDGDNPIILFISILFQWGRVIELDKHSAFTIIIISYQRRKI